MFSLLSAPSSVLSTFHKTDVCIECIYEDPVTELSQIEPGQHILFQRAKYDHHAIVVETEKSVNGNKTKLMVAHATNTSSGGVTTFLLGRGKAELQIQSIDIDLDTDKIIIYRYRASVNPFPATEVVARARKEIEQISKDGYKYNIFDNNCEHFATYCILGRKVSLQASKAKLTYKIWCKGGLKSISSEIDRNKALYESRLLCVLCFIRNKSLLEVPYTDIRNQIEVKPGDIINYNYYKLSHHAVVTQVKDRSPNVVNCSIVHYTFSLLGDNTVQEEDFTIPLNGSVKLISYERDFEVFERDVVVKRAQSRVGEQRFIYYVNDSQHLSQWCKIKPAMKTKLDVSGTLTYPKGDLDSHDCRSDLAGAIVGKE